MSRSEDSEKLRENIARTRQELTLSTRELKESLARELDWREWFRERPWTWLGLTFLIGWSLGRGRK